MEAETITNPTSFSGMAPKVIYKPRGSLKKLLLPRSARIPDQSGVERNGTEPNSPALTQDPRNLCYDFCFKNSSDRLMPFQAKVPTQTGKELQKNACGGEGRNRKSHHTPPRADTQPYQEDTN